MTSYDTIEVGARCAGSPTAIRLARKGYKVLVVDKTSFPSDTLSTHLMHPPGVAALERWGLLDRLVTKAARPTTAIHSILDTSHSSVHPARTWPWSRAVVYMAT